MKVCLYASATRPSSDRASVSALLAAAVFAALAVPTAAQLQFDELPRKGLPMANDFPRSVALGDVDGDGDLDMVLGNVGQNRLYLNDGTGTFSDVTATQLPAGGASAVALGDVDSDGDFDLVVGNVGQSRLYLNNGTGTFTDATATRMPTGSYGTTSLALGDVDRDGDLDLVVGNTGYYGEQSRLYLNNGTGTFTDATATRMPVGQHGTTSLALGDVDGDGDLDLVVGNSGIHGGGSLLYLNNGTGTFTDATATRMPTGSYGTTSSLALGDVDSDGDFDLVVGNNDSYVGVQSLLYLNNGTGTFTDATATCMPTGSYATTSLALGDVDSDGDLDVVVGNSGHCGSFGGCFPEQSLLYLNNGTGTFTDVTARMPAALEFANSLALGDVDRDGDLDLIIGNTGPLIGSSAYTDRLYFNLQRQLHAPVQPHIGQTYTLDAYSRYGPPSLVDIALPYISLARASVPFPPFGTIGIDTAQMFALPPFLIPQPAGVGSLAVAVPNVPGLIGLPVYMQALLVPYPLQERLSSVVGEVIGP